MSFSNDFQTQWISLSNYIVSGLIKVGNSQANLVFEEAEKLYKNEILRWEMEGQYNAEWLNKLSMADSTVANDFENKLKSFKFNKVEKAKRFSSLNYIAAGVGGAAGIGISFLVKWSTLAIVGTGVASTAICAIIGSKIANVQNEKSSDKEIDQYKKQLSDLGEQLLNIVKKADGKEFTEM